MKNTKFLIGAIGASYPCSSVKSVVKVLTTVPQIGSKSPFSIIP